MRRLGRLDGDEGDQRYPCGIAGRHHGLHADLHRERRYVRSSQYDSSGECRHGANTDANSNPDFESDTHSDTDFNPDTGACGRKLRHAVGRQDYFL